jgi:pimeloyl-ACP methyl ester carboxylesterase
MKRKTSSSREDLDRQFRAAERATFAHYGATASERVISVDTGVGRTDVRLSIFGPENSPEPPILLLHGIASLTVLAAPLLPHLDGRQIIGVDWPGHGLSGPCVLGPGMNVRHHAVTTIRSLLDSMDLRQVDVVGNSMGAQFGTYAALDLGSRIRRLVLLGAPGAGFVGVRPIPVAQLVAVPVLGQRLFSAPVSDKAFERSISLLLGPGALADTPAELRTSMRLGLSRRSNAASIASYFRAFIRRRKIRIGVPISLTELAALAQPALLCWGDDDVFQKPLAAATSIVSIRDVRLIRVPHAGHAPWLQAPDLVGQAIANHLR